MLAISSLFNFNLQVLHACYTKVSPSVAVDDPQLVVWSESVAELLDLDNKEFVSHLLLIIYYYYPSYFNLLDFRLFSDFKDLIFPFSSLVHLLCLDHCLMLNAMVDINLVCGLASWVMVEQSLLVRYSILTLKGGSYSLKVLVRLLTVALPMVLLFYVAASGSSFAVKQCIISGFQLPVLFLLSPLESWLLEICSTSMLTQLTLFLILLQTPCFIQ